MILRNKWTGGKVQLHVPPLPPKYKGASGSVFRTFVFDEKTGEETVLVLMDDPQFTRKLGATRPFDLTAVTGAVRTSAGIIGFIIWTVSSGQKHIVDYEHPLNPFDMGTIRLLSGVAQQSHLKVLVSDSYSSEIVGFFEFKNTFHLDQLAMGIAKIIGNEPDADFSATQAALQREFSLELMKGQGVIKI